MQLDTISRLVSVKAGKPGSSVNVLQIYLSINQLILSFQRKLHNGTCKFYSESAVTEMYNKITKNFGCFDVSHEAMYFIGIL